MTIRTTRAWPALAALAAAVAAGCGTDAPPPAGLKIHGQVLRDGKPLGNEAGPGHYDLHLTGRGGERAVLDVRADGTFAGPTAGPPLTPGTYKGMLMRASLATGGPKDRPPVLPSKHDIDIRADKADGYTIEF